MEWFYIDDPQEKDSAIILLCVFTIIIFGWPFLHLAMLLIRSCLFCGIANKYKDKPKKPKKSVADALDQDENEPEE